MFQYHRPAGLLLINLIAANHIGHDRLCRAGGIIPQMSGISASQAHVALQQRRRLVEYAVRTPAVGAGKNRCRAVAFPNPPMLCVDKIQCLLPAHPHKLVLATHALRTIRRSKETFTYHRIADAGFAVYLLAHRGLQGVGERGLQRTAGREDIFTIRFNQHRPPVSRG